MITKIDLLNNYNIFLDNEWLDKYVELINDNLSSCKIPFETNVHHIVPKFYFVNNSLDIDNSSNNLVHLSISDHGLAHYLLANCSSTEEYRYKNILASRIILHGNFDILNLNDADLANLNETLKNYIKEWSLKMTEINTNKKCKEETRQKIKSALLNHVVTEDTRNKISFANKGKSHLHTEKTKQKLRNSHIGKHLTAETKQKLREINIGKHHTEETKDKISKSLKGRQSSNKDKICVTKDNVNKLIYKDNLEYYISNGWVLGKYLSEDAKQKIKDGNKNIKHFANKTSWKKGTIPWNKGVSIQGHPQSDETRKKISEAHKGKIGNALGTVWINNSIVNKRISINEVDSYLNNGWVKGKLQKQK